MSSPPPVLGKRRSNRAAVFTTATLAVTAQGKYCKHCTAEEAQQFSWVVKGLVQVVHHRHSHHAASSGSYRTEHVLQAVQAEQAQYVSQAGLMDFLFDRQMWHMHCLLPEPLRLEARGASSAVATL